MAPAKETSSERANASSNFFIVVAFGATGCTYASILFWVLLRSRLTCVLLDSSLIVFLFVVGLLWACRFYTDRRVWRMKVGIIGLNALLILGLILCPTKVLSKGNDFFDYDGSNVLASYARA